MLGILKKTSFLLAVTNFCWTVVQSWSKPTILDKMQSIKDNSKTNMNNIVQLGCLISKLLRLFVNFLSGNVVLGLDLVGMGSIWAHCGIETKVNISIRDLKGGSYIWKAHNIPLWGCWNLQRDEDAPGHETKCHVWKIKNKRAVFHTPTHFTGKVHPFENMSTIVIVFYADYWCSCCKYSFHFVVSKPTRIGFIYGILFPKFRRLLCTQLARIHLFIL